MIASTRVTGVDYPWANMTRSSPGYVSGAMENYPGTLHQEIAQTDARLTMAMIGKT